MTPCIPLGRSPRLIDICCCAGAASVGYHRAGFEVEGFDIEPQQNYPYKFTQADLRDLDPQWIADNFDAAHASPPCQFYSAMSNCRPGLAAKYPDLIGPARDLFEAAGVPYVIENVPLARAWMRDPVTLCGAMFGRELYRHRLFETNWPLAQPEHVEHTIPASKAGHWRPGTVMSVAGHVAPVAKADSSWRSTGRPAPSWWRPSRPTTRSTSGRNSWRTSTGAR